MEINAAFLENIPSQKNEQVLNKFLLNVQSMHNQVCLVISRLHQN